VFAIALGAVLALPAARAAESQCFGSVGNGRLEGGVKLPASGANFEAYSSMGWVTGRTYVHSKVADVILATYRALADRKDSVRFVYGETGWKSGGRFRPHRTHQNGLSVDFFVPVKDRAGKPATLPIRVTNKLGYDIEFDASGRFEDYTIDFESVAEHLYQLDVAARARGVGLAMVILDHHDEHYHIDFSIPCKPNAR
jgi:penicillin-insensitive murein endopeptidase